MKALPIVAGLLLVAALAFCGQRLGDSLPQLAKGDGVLSVAFGDARETISRAMVHKADSYFHGGVDMECTLDHEHECDGEECHHEHHHETGVHEGDMADSDNPNTQTPKHPNTASRDPWRWINSHIRAPEIERHLEGERAVEMMPWFWAAVKADPHNIDAWTTALYMASTSMKDDALTQKVLQEARGANPDSLEILLFEGKFLYKLGKGDVDAAEKVFESVRDAALLRCNKDPTQLTESDLWAYKFALNYLADIGKKRTR